MFERWWNEEGQYIEPDFSDLKELSAIAFEAGRKYGVAVSGNYTANDATLPTEVNFENGRRVKLNIAHDGTAYLTVGKF